MKTDLGILFEPGKIGTLEATGVNGICISSGAHGTKMPASATYVYPGGIFVPLAKAIKEAVKIPVLV